MKLLIFFFLTLFSMNGYGQKLDSTLKKLIHQYASTSHIKTDCVNHMTRLKVGTFTTTGLITNRRTGTIDSERGELTTDGSTIYYDIGFSAGAHMSSDRKNECGFYTEQNFKGYKTDIGLIKKEGKSELIITIWGDYTRSVSCFPANFWRNIDDEKDIKAMLEIVSSYKPAE
jgi:hypothetical protein